MNRLTVSDQASTKLATPPRSSFFWRLRLNRLFSVTVTFTWGLMQRQSHEAAVRLITQNLLFVTDATHTYLSFSIREIPLHIIICGKSISRLRREAAGGRRHTGSRIVKGTHRLRALPTSRTQIARTKRFRLNVPPNRVCRTDVAKAF